MSAATRRLFLAGPAVGADLIPVQTDGFQQTIQNLEGAIGQRHLEEYADATTERGQILLDSICKEMGFHSLGYQTLDGLLEAIGLDRDKVCTYCWTGEE